MPSLKRFGLFWLAIALSSSACGRPDAAVAAPLATLEISGAGNGVTWSVHAGVITTSNGLLELRWNAASGALTALTSLASGTNFLGGDARASWSIALDGSTADVFAARAPLTPLGRQATTLVAFDTRLLSAGGLAFDLTYAPMGAATIVQHVTLAPADPVSHWTTDVSLAAGAHATAIEIASPALLGVASQPGEQLVWPWHEGVILPVPGTTYQSMQYPSPASMQWMDLFTAKESLYVAALDSTGSYKELHFGFDPASALPGSPRQMSVVFFPFATSAKKYTTPEVEVGVAPEGGWYWGADRYRAFLASAGMKRALPSIVTQMPGWHKGYDRFPLVPPGLASRPPDIDYCQIPTANMPADYASRTGLSILLMYGWYFDGQDSNFPDFDFLSKGATSSTCLQATDLTNALAELAARTPSNRVMFYINAHIADDASDWMHDPANAASAAMRPDGTRYTEYYPDWPGRTFRAMCPSASRWQDQIDATAMRLRKLAPSGAGAVGVYWDQQEEMPSALCYDRTHGHATPASAYPEGYRALFTRISQDFSLGGTDTGYIFAAEGANDFYSQFIDVAGGEPGRLMGFKFPVQPSGDCRDVVGPCGASITHAPEVGRYTMFARFLGLSNDGAKKDAADEFARAFLMGDPLRTNPTTDASNPYQTTNANVFPRLTNIYVAEPSIYFDGVFKDANGLSLTVDPASARGTIIVGGNGDRFGIQLWNETAAALDVGVSVDLARLGLTASPSAALLDLDGLMAPALVVQGSRVSFTVSLPANDVKAMKVSL